MSENKENKQKVTNEKIEKIKVTDIDIILTNRFPNRYEIKYKKVGEQEYRTGFGSYNLDLVADWKEENFELVTEEEQKEEKQDEVTNEKLLEHLNEVEVAIGCIANGINTLFSVIVERKEQLKLSKSEAKMLYSGQIALVCLSERMADISRMNERVKENVEEVHAVEKEDFLDFLKEILS